MGGGAVGSSGGVRGARRRPASPAKATQEKPGSGASAGGLSSPRKGPRQSRDGAAGDDQHIVDRLARQAGRAGKPAAEAPRPGVVGRRGEAEIAEAGAQLLEVGGGFIKRAGRLERVGKPALRRRAGHELGDALRSGRAARGGIEAALLPDQPREEAVGQIVAARGRLQRAAQGDGGRGGGNRAGGRRAWRHRRGGACGHGEGKSVSENGGSTKNGHGAGKAQLWDDVETGAPWPCARRHEFATSRTPEGRN